MVDTWPCALYGVIMIEKPLVLDVGQCNMDHNAIRELLIRLGATVHRAHSVEEARTLMRKNGYALVLINRIFDETGEEGLAFVEDVCAAGGSAMLVSNYPEAQAEAVARGAMQGFGKAALRDPRTVELLQRCLEPRGQ